MKSLFAGIAAAFVLAAPAVAAPTWDGTWKTDTASIKFAKKPSTYLLKDGKYSCPTCIPAYSVPADGAFHKVTGDPYLDETSIRVVDAHTIKQVIRKGGKEQGEGTFTVSADGKTIATAFIDKSAPNGVAVTGKGMMTRVGATVPGAHAISGDWVDSKIDVTDSGSLYSFKLAGDMLSFASKTGQSYTAKIDGPEAPVKGDAGWSGVKLASKGPMTLVETDYRGPKATTVLTETLSADGKTMQVDVHNLLRDTTSHFTMIRQ